MGEILRDLRLITRDPQPRILIPPSLSGISQGLYYLPGTFWVALNGERKISILGKVFLLKGLLNLAVSSDIEVCEPEPGRCPSIEGWIHPKADSRRRNWRPRR
jgi:hypothetical protein